MKWIAHRNERRGNRSFITVAYPGRNTRRETAMRLAMAYPFLVAYHEEMGLADEEVEALAERAWNDGAGPHVVAPGADGSWLTWPVVAAAIERDLRSRILARLRRRL
jgi:hypothetical protein